MTAAIMPQALESEEAILGAVIASPRALEVADAAGLRADHFYRDSHRVIYTAIKAASEREAVDVHTVIRELERAKALAAAGGKAVIATLPDRCPAISNAKAYAADVVNHAVYRKLVDAGQAIAAAGYERAEDPEKLVGVAAELVANLTGSAMGTQGGFTDFDELYGPLYDSLTERYEADGDIVGLRTGFTEIDDVLGGLRPGNTYVLAARPAMGKSSLLLDMLLDVALVQRKGVGMFSLEMSKEDLAAKVMANRAKIDARRLMSARPFDSDFDAVTNAMADIRGAGTLHFDDTSTLRTFDIKTRARRLAVKLKRAGTPLAVLGVDYMQLVEGDASKGALREQEVAKISRDLKQLAGELHIPIIALSQLNRASEKRDNKRPQLSDLRESGGIEQDATAVMFLHRPEYYDRDNPELAGFAEVIVAKNRFGPTRTSQPIMLGWLEKYAKFVNLTSASPRGSFVAGTGAVA